MPITFAPLVGAETEGTASVELVVGVDGRALALLSGEADTDLLFVLRCEAYVEQFDDAPAVPLIPSNANLDFVLAVDSVVGLVRHMLFDAEVALRMSVLALPDNSVELEIQVSVDAVEPFTPTSYVFASERGMAVVCYGGAAFDEYVVDVVFSAETEANIMLVLESIARFADKATWAARLSMTLASSFAAKDLFVVLLEAVFSDTLSMNDDSALVSRMIISLADQLVLTGEVTNYMDALITVSAAFALSEKITFGQDMTVEDALQIDAATVEKIGALIELVDQMDVADETVFGATFTAILTDTVTLSDESDYGLAAFMELLDQVNFGVRLNFPGLDAGLYVGYAMNLRNAGVTTYDNYPFVDAAEVGGLALAVNDEGLYLLEGADDDGAPIRAKLRTGLTDFGSQVLKHAPNMWVGYTTDGSLVCKVITTDRGTKKENWYQLKARTSPSPTGDRFSAAKGLVSMYWGFEIVNVDGADFELDTIRVWPFVVQRRKSGR